MNEANKRRHRSRNSSGGTEVSAKGLGAQASGRITNNLRPRAQQCVVSPRCLLLQHHSLQESLAAAMTRGQVMAACTGKVRGETVPRLRDRALLPRAASHPFPELSCLLNSV